MLQGKDILPEREFVECPFLERAYTHQKRKMSLLPYLFINVED